MLKRITIKQATPNNQNKKFGLMKQLGISSVHQQQYRNFHYNNIQDETNSSEESSTTKLNRILTSSFDPSRVEQDWYSWWEEKGLFKGEDSTTKPQYTILLPPPNVTGSLHIGHALTASIQDSLCRYKKMNGYNVLWVPGVDHAGISTQVAVEKKIAKEEGKTRHDLGREEFLKRVWSWKEEYGNRIDNQMKAMGSMTDWSRKVFTMDAQFSSAVLECFVRLARDGLIYRDAKLVNWCPQLNTAISDIEVEYISLKKKTKVMVPSCEEKSFDFGVMHTFKYPVISSPGSTEIIGYINVSTTRLETMLGDTAVAIHPEDERYKNFHNKFILHPFDSKRAVPIICDEKLVNMEIGTGAVKITPAHSFEDFECGKRHGLEFITILNKDGSLNDQVPVEFSGKNRFIVRKLLVDKLKDMELFISEQDHEMELPICSRSKDILEPMLLNQWFVKCDSLAKKALDLVNNNEILIHPSYHKTTWNNWLENIHDWCISRQLWWGHRIPAFKLVGDLSKLEPLMEELRKEKSFIMEYSNKNSSNIENIWIVAHKEEEAISILQKNVPNFSNFVLEQDEDVLDTWFSSGLYPLAAFGWPSRSENVLKDLDYRYPSSVMETGSDILFFWVARMVMLCTYLSDNKEKPFNEIYLHSMVRDKQGRKMSKSLGNVIDPIDMIKGTTFEDLKRGIEKNTNITKQEMKKALQGVQQEFPNGIPQCGTDALRFTLIQYTQQGRQINLDVMRAQSNRHLCNKIWQSARFCLSHFERFNYSVPGNDENLSELLLKSFASLEKSQQVLQNQWILLNLSETIDVTRNSIDNFMFSDGCTSIYQFFIYQFCDNYLEIVKPILHSSNTMTPLIENTLHTLNYCLVTVLKLLHPYMPFITEELYHCCPLNGENNALYAKLSNKNSSYIPTSSILECSYPTSFTADEIGSILEIGSSKQLITEKMDKILQIVQQLRSMKQNLQLPSKSELTAYIFYQGSSTTAFNLSENDIKIIQTLTKFTSIKFITEEESKKHKHTLYLTATAFSTPQGTVMTQLVLPDEFQLEKEIEKWQKKIEQLASVKAKYLKQVHPNLPPEVKQQIEDKLSQNQIETQKAQETCSQLEHLLDNKNQ
ncbi:valyl tRNA synthetase [Naegleria gruberi]|uniref:valine--tRNA ligase n=1 Tax=Naegleria gruberi TaxID=5762 RepID=D2VDP9_NAEGR|nr:valyl tRNA synthetase [Naegleria gruberi]EFC45041.1 valyl tRNA synthetase [Naegleria gruberi]|eukprot:XP_002677785.1 valyl tRNA synthetase [Naegleria gruberi strain NEG-M]